MPRVKWLAHPIYREGEDRAHSLEQNISQFEAMLTNGRIDVGTSSVTECKAW
jgi:predicted solute-binding protein